MKDTPSENDSGTVVDALLKAIEQGLLQRARFLGDKAARFSQGPEDYKQLRQREMTMMDLAEAVANARRF